MSHALAVVRRDGRRPSAIFGMPLRLDLWCGRLARTCVGGKFEIRNSKFEIQKIPVVDPDRLSHHHHAMRRLVPVSVLLLVAGWLAASALDLPRVAAAVAVSCIGAVCVGAVRGRAPDRRLATALSAILIALLAALLFLLGKEPGGATGLYLQLAIMALLAPIVPIVYALTFPADRDIR